MNTDVSVPLRRLAHGRTGDKGNRSCISIIAYRDEFWPLLVEQVTAAVVESHFGFRQPTQTIRYLLPLLGAMNFVIDDVLDGGVNDALNLDSHGKALSFLLLDLPIRVPLDLEALLAGDAAGGAGGASSNLSSNLRSSPDGKPGGNSGSNLGANHGGEPT